MAIPINNYSEFEELVERLWNQTPLFGFVLHDSRESHQAVAAFLEQSAGWLDELAIQSGIYILFPLRTGKQGFLNPSPIIAKEFGLQSNRLPGIVLFTTSDEKGRLTSKHFLFVPLKDADFGDVEGMQATVADIFSIVQTTLFDGKAGHEALESIKLELSNRRRKKTRDSIIESLRAGAQIVLKQFPEKFITSFAESFAKSLAASILK